ncbi:hypothetical protein CTKZ_02470 [Cellulomonas algicola]|uniref:Uncharacterized protein n=1 Tax=Cellulomonas algicola TaxID=2071633 RepID=A0A401UVH2_9CELL|nr:hypothetical protein [Cellulomonas algicola]GCD18685.1 hypothetical protein CTKZ_02470 [Cellulomonas algicola]
MSAAGAASAAGAVGVAVVAGALLVLALLDGAFSGFRSAHGRDGRVHLPRARLRSQLHGAAATAVVLGPVVLGASLDVVARPSALDAYVRAGIAMLTVYVPYAVVVLLAVGAYALLDWRHRFLATAVVLGPGTFLRPAVAIAGGVLAVRAAADGRVAVLAAASVVAVLVVEPLLDRRWRRRAPELALVGPATDGAHDVGAPLR